VVIVEDEGAVALMLEDLLEDLGFALAGSFARVASAREAMKSAAFDFAVLDINVAGETSFDLARALGERGIPFVFSTGYGTAAVPADLSDRYVLTKPFSAADLLRAVQTAMG
jgi:DNA-binding NtrC family response regulator